MSDRMKLSSGGASREASQGLAGVHEECFILVIVNITALEAKEWKITDRGVLCQMLLHGGVKFRGSITMINLPRDSELAACRLLACRIILNYTRSNKCISCRFAACRPIRSRLSPHAIHILPDALPVVLYGPETLGPRESVQPSSLPL